MQSPSAYIDPNNIDFRDSWPPVGTITGLKHIGSSIEVSGSLYLSDSAKPLILLILDSARRFVAAQPLFDRSFRLQFSDRHLKTSAWPLISYAYEPHSNIARQILLEAVCDVEDVNDKKIPSYRDRYIKDIVAALTHSYTSISSKAEIKTGNGYQSIDLDRLSTAGGRPARSLFFAHVNFKGKRVLDIGANTGELSRLARRRGADLVDGYEYDPFFVETGRMLNAVTGMTRVSLFQGDATNPRLYDGMRYDMVLAFAVWVYIEAVLEEIAKTTDTMFFETHTLDHGLDMYLKPLTSHFPFFRHMGHDQNREMRKSRAVLMFAKSESALQDALRLTTVTTDPYFTNAFFSAYPRTNPAEFMAFAAHVAAQVKDTTRITGLGKAYFELLLAGYLEYVNHGKRVTPNNVFLQRFRIAIEGGSIDQSLRHLLESEDQLMEKVARKYGDIDHALEGRWNLIPPIIVRPGDGPLSFNVSGQRLRAQDIDGHHRFFVSQLLSRPAIEAMIREPLKLERSEINTHYRL